MLSAVVLEEGSAEEGIVVNFVGCDSRPGVKETPLQADSTARAQGVDFFS